MVDLSPPPMYSFYLEVGISRAVRRRIFAATKNTYRKNHLLKYNVTNSFKVFFSVSHHICYNNNEYTHALRSC